MLLNCICRDVITIGLQQIWYVSHLETMLSMHCVADFCLVPMKASTTPSYLVLALEFLPCLVVIKLLRAARLRWHEVISIYILHVSARVPLHMRARVCACVLTPAALSSVHWHDFFILRSVEWIPCL